MNDYSELRAKAEAARGHDPRSRCLDCWAWQDAATPDVVLALLDEVERLRAEKEQAPTCEVCGQRCDCTDGTHDNGVAPLETRLRAVLAETSCEKFVLGCNAWDEPEERCLRCEFEAALNSSTGQQNAPVAEGDNT